VQNESGLVFLNLNLSLSLLPRLNLNLNLNLFSFLDILEEFAKEQALGTPLHQRSVQEHGDISHKRKPVAAREARAESVAES
jgi:hypothetical protein